MMLERLALSAAEAIVEALLQAGVKFIGQGSASRIGSSRKSRRLIAEHVERVLRDVTKMVTYRAAEQHIEEAYVQPRLIDAPLVRLFLRPSLVRALRESLAKGEDEVALNLLSAFFKPGMDRSIARYALEELRRSTEADDFELAESGSQPEEQLELRFISPSEVLQERGVLVLGEAGGGKSALLARLCFRRLQESPHRIPVFLAASQLRDRTPLEALATTLADLGLDSVAPSRLEKCLAFYIDGLDELPLSGYREACRDIAAMRKQFPLAPLIAACRNAAYEGNLAFLKEISLAPFNRVETAEFVRRWFKPLAQGPTAEDFLTTLQKEDHLRELATQPLLLALMCNAYRRHLHFSRRYSTLFGQCIDALFWAWDAERGVRRESGFSDLDSEKRVWLHAQIAFELHSSRSRFVDYRTFRSLIESRISSYGIDAGEAPAVIKEMCSHYGVIVKITEDTYGFGHLALQEYLAGKWLSQERRWEVRFDDVMEDPWWRNVIALTVSSLSDGTEAIEFILNSPSLDDLGRYRLAAHCLKYDPIVAAQTRKLIAQRLLHWYHNSDLKGRDQALLMLVGIEDEYTARIIRTSLRSHLPTRKDAEIAGKRLSGQGFRS